MFGSRRVCIELKAVEDGWMPVIQDTVFLGGKNSGSNRCQQGTFCDGQQEGMVRTGVYMPSPRVTFSTAWQICHGVLWNRMPASLQQLDGLKYNVCVPVYAVASLKKEQAITVQKSAQAQTILEVMRLAVLQSLSIQLRRALARVA